MVEGMVWYGMVWYGMVRYGTVRYGTVRYGTVRYGTVRYGTVRYGMVLSGMVWYGMACGSKGKGRTLSERSNAYILMKEDFDLRTNARFLRVNLNAQHHHSKHTRYAKNLFSDIIRKIS